MSSDRLCSVAGCDRPFSAKGFCKQHYERARLGKPTDSLLRPSHRDTALVERLRMFTEPGPAGCVNFTGRRHLTAVSGVVDAIRDPHGLPRPEERRVRHFFVNPATQLQVVVNVWPDGTFDAAFESEPGVFGVPVAPRRTESEIVG